MGRHIAIAWRDDGRAIKAVIPALRYFAGAGEISVLVGYRGDTKPEALPPALAERGVKAAVYPLAIRSGPFGEQLLAKAAELGADLLVTGAYMHSPLREMLLGGVTRYLLGHAEIPVLMRH
jgi:nucleotide-binding universal stress UspA family protein